MSHDTSWILPTSWSMLSVGDRSTWRLSPILVSAAIPARLARI